MGGDVLSLADDSARGGAAVALRVSKDRRAIPYLAKAIDDSDPYVRIIAIDALGELGAVAHINSIAGHLDDRETTGDCLKSCPAEAACRVVRRLVAEILQVGVGEVMELTRLRGEVAGPVQIVGKF